MELIKNVKGTILDQTLIWNGLELKPKTEFQFSLTEKQYNLLKDRFVKFESDFENSNKEIIVEEKLENNKPLEDNVLIKSSEEKIDLIEEKNINENEVDLENLTELISKRESIVEQQEEQKRIAFERKKMEEVRPIPKQIKRKPIKK